MLRPFVLASLVSTVTLGWADPAAAEDLCMCAEGRSWSIELPESTELSEGPAGERLQSIEVGPLFSSDGTMLSSWTRLERTAEEGWLVHTTPPVEDVLWCSGRDDPRCSPADPGPENGPQNGRASHAGAILVVGEHRIPPALETTLPSVLRNGSREGVRARVERPPRP